MLGGSVATSAGVSVSSESALRVPAVSRAVTLISDTIASFPLIVERRDGGAWVPDLNHPVTKLLEVGANDWTSTPEFVRDMIIAALTFDEGARAWVSRTGDRIHELVHYRPGSIGVEYASDGSGRPITYRLMGRPIDPADVIHLRSPFRQCPVSRAREAIGAAMVMEKYGSRLFGNGARPGGILKTKKTVGDKGVLSILKGWKAAHEGPDASGSTAVLWDDMDWVQTTLTSVDAQFLELKKEQVVEVARSFGVPPAFLFELGRSTWGNYEQQTKTFLASLESWMTPFEASMRRALFSAKERPEWRISFDRDDLSAVDLTSRATAISSLISSRVINPNEARPWVGRGLAPYDGGNEFANPNTGASQPGVKPQPNKPEAEDDNDDSE